jgi:hypothetical protein
MLTIEQLIQNYTHKGVLQSQDNNASTNLEFQQRYRKNKEVSNRNHWVEEYYNKWNEKNSVKSFNSSLD